MSSVMCISDIDQLDRFLVFVTGMAELPALGFFPKPEVTFGHADDLKGNFTARFPVSSTCSNSIRLPVLTNWDEFEANMTNAVMLATSFTLA
jgi:HECT-domain (ubiquitin-transferase)